MALLFVDGLGCKHERLAEFWRTHASTSQSSQSSQSSQASQSNGTQGSASHLVARSLISGEQGYTPSKVATPTVFTIVQSATTNIPSEPITARHDPKDLISDSEDASTSTVVEPKVTSSGDDDAAPQRMPRAFSDEDDPQRSIYAAHGHRSVGSGESEQGESQAASPPGK